MWSRRRYGQSDVTAPPDLEMQVRTISLAYSKITFADIAAKLMLDSPEDAEFIVAKVRDEVYSRCHSPPPQAIRDGVIEAVLDHESGTMQSRDTSDVYGTREPQIAFNQRIEFCLDLHNHSVITAPPSSGRTIGVLQCARSLWKLLTSRLIQLMVTTVSCTRLADTGPCLHGPILASCSPDKSLSDDSVAGRTGTGTDTGGTVVTGEWL